MELRASGEDYLEAILILQLKQGMVRSVDLARFMDFSKASISHAVGLLRNGGFLTVDKEGYLLLTEIGRETAAKIYERHCFFRDYLIRIGVDTQTAESCACKMEHVISEEGFQEVKMAFKSVQEANQIAGPLSGR